MQHKTSLSELTDSFKNVLLVDADANAFLAEFASCVTNYEQLQQEKEFFLKEQLGTAQSVVQKKNQSDLSQATASSGSTFSSSKILNIIKKNADVLDDIWKALGNILSHLINPKLVDLISYFIVGVFDSFIHIFEAKEEINELQEVMSDPSAPERHVRIGLGVWNVFLAVSGSLLSVGVLGAGIAVAAGVAILTAVFTILMAVVSGLLTAIYINRLLKNSALLDTAKKQEEKKELDYLNELLVYPDYIALLKEEVLLEAAIRHINDHEQHARKSVPNTIFQKINEHEPLTDTEVEQYAAYLHASSDRHVVIAAELESVHCVSTKELYNKMGAVCHQIENHGDTIFNAKRTAYYVAHQEKLAAERKVAFNVLEVIGSALAFIGGLFGLLPVIIFGVAVGFVSQVIDCADDHFGNKMTLGVRNFFTRNDTKKQQFLREQHDVDYVRVASQELAAPQTSTALVRQRIYPDPLALSTIMSESKSMQPVQSPINQQPLLMQDEDHKMPRLSRCVTL